MQPDTGIVQKKKISLLSSCTVTGGGKAGGAHMNANN